MPFCYAPWSNVDISPQGTIAPCCKFRHDRYDAKPCNINDTSLADYGNSQVLNLIKQDFELGRWPAGCERCRIEEENGIASKRQLDHRRWQDHYHHYNMAGWLTASIAFGNTCNLTCITCGPWASSRWQQEYQNKYKIDVRPNHFNKKDFVNDFLALASGLIHLDVPGGEPFLSGIEQQFDLLEQIVKQDRASEVSLHYTTNASIFPDGAWWQLWSNFKEIDLQISLDGVGDRNSYIRYPSDWNTINKHIALYQHQEQSLDNLRLSISHTVSVYNVYYLPEFFDWCLSRGLPRPWVGRVHTPISMRPSVWPGAAKEYIINHLENSQHEDCRVWAEFLTNTDDSENFKQFVELVHWHDEYRGVNFTDTFPELAKYVAQA